MTSDHIGTGRQIARDIYYFPGGNHASVSALPFAHASACRNIAVYHWAITAWDWRGRPFHFFYRYRKTRSRFLGIDAGRRPQRERFRQAEDADSICRLNR